MLRGIPSAKMNRTPNTSRQMPKLLLPSVIVAIAGGCSSLPPSPEAVALRQSVIDSVRQSFEDEAGTRKPTPAEPVTRDLGLSSERISELQGLSGPASYKDSAADLGPDLSGDESTEIPVTLARATELALLGGTDAWAAWLAPADHPGRSPCRAEGGL